MLYMSVLYSAKEQFVCGIHEFGKTAKCGILQKIKVKISMFIC